MSLDPTLLVRFREELSRAREADPGAWEASRRLVGAARLADTVARLAETVRTSALDASLREAVLAAVTGTTGTRPMAPDGERLKALTGLPGSKAVRALCVRFGLTATTQTAPTCPSPSRVEAFLRRSMNPYDLLLETEGPSLVDLGAGDLSFAAELADQYVPRLRAVGRDLIVHAVDRLRPDSRLGGRLHADPDRLRRLRHGIPGLAFRFWAGEDMFQLGALTGLRGSYTIATCHGPATPTFAFEPTRVSPATIEAHLRRTKGDFRRVHMDGEEALEVLHGGRALLFPAWKFEIRGPLALLELVACKGALAVLGAVDDEVFWELLAQLLADERVRPRDVILSAPQRSEIFGEVHRALTALRPGESAWLADIAPLRPTLPRVLGEAAAMPAYRFRAVQIRRGAVFEGLPAGQTARLFKDMPEEAPPWFVVLVPEPAAAADAPATVRTDLARN